MSTYLILGSAGQIGSALASYARREGHEVIDFDILFSCEQDLRLWQNPSLLQAMEKADFVFFLAFDVGGARYLQAYQETPEFIGNNLRLMAETFSALERGGKPFIFASSQMSNMSYSSYGRLKGVGESYTRALGGLVVKFWNVYGIEHDLAKSHVITDLIIKAHDTGVIDLMTDGTEERQFLYADDCSEALLTLAEKYDAIPRDRELHVTTHTWSTVLEVAGEISRHFPGAIVRPASSKDGVQRNKRNEADPFVLSYWKPRTSLAEGIAAIVEGMKSESSHFFKKLM